MNDVERTMPIRRPTAPALPALPRRRTQAHLEPQLREPGGSGTGTPFLAFVPAAGPDRSAGGRDRCEETVEQPAVAEAVGPGGRRASAGARAATFRAARTGARLEAQRRN